MKIAFAIYNEEPMERSIFKDTTWNKEINEDGFVKCKFLEANDIADLLSIANSFGFKTGDVYKGKLVGMNVSLFDARKEQREKFFDAVWNILASKVNNVLDRYEPVMINFWSKLPGGGDLELHQNWTHVNEADYTSLSLWIPLQPTSRKNGTLEVVPKSHKKIGTVRGPGIGHMFERIEKEIIDKYLIPIDLEVGEVAFIDDSIVHYTGHNNDVSPRNSIQVLLKPAEAPALFFIGDGKEVDNTVKCFEVERNFFSNLELSEARIKEPKLAKLVNTFKSDFKQLSLPEFESIIAN
jgi:hypothetical protein